MLVSHVPPKGVLDRCYNGDRAGSRFLRDAVTASLHKPRLWLFGHIHEGAGATTDGTTTYVNASTCTLRYKATNPPLVFDVTARE